MNLNQTIVKALATATMIGGIIVVIGWIFGITVLTSIKPEWVTMKFSTSISFICAGIILYSIVKYHEGKIGIAQLGLSLGMLMILLLMAPLFTSVFLDVRTGVEDFIIKEQPDAVRTTTAGRPSIGTMTNFLLITLSAVLTLFSPKNMRSLSWIGVIVLVIGGIAIFGYVMNMESLYYRIDGRSTAMALHTAIFFVMLGAALLALGKKSSVLRLEVIEHEN